jgi:hypothetical protein
MNFLSRRKIFVVGKKSAEIIQGFFNHLEVDGKGKKEKDGESLSFYESFKCVCLGGI